MSCVRWVMRKRCGRLVDMIQLIGTSVVMRATPAVAYSGALSMLILCVAIHY